MKIAPESELYGSTTEAGLVFARLTSMTRGRLEPGTGENGAAQPQKQQDSGVNTSAFAGDCSTVLPKFDCKCL